MKLSSEEERQIAEARTSELSTRRPTVSALEQLLYSARPVLDHGFVRVVDYMGDDTSVVQAARVSYGRGTRKVSDDTNLIRYLLRHNHTTPFEMAEIKLHVKLPIFVARQWIRHRTASVNEYSARYSTFSSLDRRSKSSLRNMAWYRRRILTFSRRGYFSLSIRRRIVSISRGLSTPFNILDFKAAVAKGASPCVVARSEMSCVCRFLPARARSGRSS